MREAALTQRNQTRTGHSLAPPPGLAILMADTDAPV